MSRCETPEPETACEVQVIPVVDDDDWEMTQDDDASCDAAPQQYLQDLLLRGPWKSGNRHRAHAPTTPSPLGPNGMNDQWIYCSKNRSILEGTWTRHTGDGEVLLVVDAIHATWHQTDASQENPTGTILWTSPINGEEPIPLDFCPIGNGVYERARAMIQGMPDIKECCEPLKLSKAVLRMPPQLEDFREEFWFSLEDDNGSRRFLFISFCSPLPLDPSYFYIYELHSSDRLKICATGSSKVDGVVIKLNYENARKPTTADDLELGPEVSLIHWAMLCWHDKFYNA